MSGSSILDGPGTAVCARPRTGPENSPIPFLLTDVGGGRPAAGPPPRRAW
ncbi:hypothetical protein ABZ921_40400 [Streptomyces atriruber]|uniref:Uncharacterized protein n=1 Tax=Streptomyces atriruber TaxID=545121 RepID=A0ABV3C0V9_9ACTN